jgi:Fic family protein
MLLQDHSGIGLRMETNSLFGGVEEKEHHDTLDKDARQWLEDLVKLINNKDAPAIVKAWLFYYHFLVLKPFASNNELLAYIVCKKILLAGGLDFFNALNLEKYVFRDKNFILVNQGLSALESYEDKLNADLSSYVEYCVYGYKNNIREIRQSVTGVVREQLDYQSLTPRQKNTLNFWLEKAFFIHKDKLDQLSPRQHEMMLLIAKYGSLSNKELVPVFMVDRKTIQRDFNVLLDMKLLEQRGGGRALKYYINLRVPLQNDILQG